MIQSFFVQSLSFHALAIGAGAAMIWAVTRAPSRMGPPPPSAEEEDEEFDEEEDEEFDEDEDEEEINQSKPEE
jgi:hypothetical protein